MSDRRSFVARHMEGGVVDRVSTPLSGKRAKTISPAPYLTPAYVGGWECTHCSLEVDAGDEPP